jgi:hypothetical protein
MVNLRQLSNSKSKKNYRTFLNLINNKMLRLKFHHKNQENHSVN